MSIFLKRIICRGILVELVLCVLLGHPNSKIANSMKLVTFAFFSSQYHVFELKNIRGNLIAPNSNRWSLSNENAMSKEDNSDQKLLRFKNSLKKWSKLLRSTIVLVKKLNSQICPTVTMWQNLKNNKQNR